MPKMNAQQLPTAYKLINNLHPCCRNDAFTELMVSILKHQTKIKMLNTMVRMGVKSMIPNRSCQDCLKFKIQ